MGRSTGTPLGVQTWLRSQRVDPTSSFSLAVQSLEGFDLVGTWQADHVSSDPAAWSAEVCELATEDANGRGQTTRYQIRHDRDGKNCGLTSMRRIVVLEDDEPSKLSFDGTNAGLVSKLLASLERAQAQVIEASRGAVQAQQQSMQLLAASYQMLGQAQASIYGLHSRAIELQQTIADGTPAAPSSPDMVKVMMETMGPTLAARMAEKLLPMLLGDGDDDAAEPTPAKQ